ncbi:C39 family peptidase [Candidatus Bipolaricaulota bacterium]|nr:C39 family peptidase [Candidatus Bipolaricaulota bacterium]
MSPNYRSSSQLHMRCLIVLLATFVLFSSVVVSSNSQGSATGQPAYPMGAHKGETLTVDSVFPTWTSSFRIRGGYVAAGAGLRNRGFGSITILGIPSGSRVEKAFLYWTVLSPVRYSSFNRGRFNGYWVSGGFLGDDIDPCWDDANGNDTARSFSYRADVTNYVTGNGTYHLSNFTSYLTTGEDPWTENRGLPPMIEGASLIVIYTNQTESMREILIYEGNKYLIADTPFEVQMDGFEANGQGTQLTVICADGQELPDNSILVNGQQIALDTFDGSDPQTGPDYSAGNLWDTDTYDISAHVKARDTSLRLTFRERTGFELYDCLVLVALILSVQRPVPEVGEAPEGSVALVSVTPPCSTTLQRGAQVLFEVTVDYELQGLETGFVGAELGLADGKCVEIGSRKEIVMGSGAVTITGTIDVDHLYEWLQDDTAYLAILIGYRVDPTHSHLLEWEHLSDCPYPINLLPNTQIESMEISNDAATFTWSGSDDTTPATELTYSYRLVRPGPAYDAWSSWSSGKTKKYTDLSPGNYKFQVRARDADGAIDPSPASREFVIGETEDHSPIARASYISNQPQTMYPDTVYTVTAQYFDPDGRDDLKYCYLRLNHPTKPITMMWYQSDGHAAPWAGEEGENYLTITDVVVTEIVDGTEGYELTWSFQINDQWPAVEDAIDFGVFASDDGDLTSGWDYDDSNASFLRDADPPALIEDFTASDGKDSQCTLHWTNPPDTDLAEVVVRRKTTGYPTDHQDGLLLVRRTSPTPGSEGRYPDTDVTNDTAYYYAVFSCDISGNWNDTVEEGKNADIGYPTRSLAVPYYNQSDTSWCWAASSTMLLKHFGFDTEPWDIAAYLGKGSKEQLIELPVYGSPVHRYLEKHFHGSCEDNWACDFFEVTASDLRDRIISILSEGSPVYLGLSKHVITIVGYADSGWNDRVYFHDPSGYLGAGTVHAELTWKEFFDKFQFLGVELPYVIIFARPNCFLAEGKPLTISVLGTTQDDQFFVVGRGEALHFRWDGRWDYGYHYSGGSDVEIETFPKDPQLDFAVTLDSKLYLNVYIANSAPYSLTPTVQLRVYRQRENFNREEITPAPIIRALGPLEGYHTYNSVSVLNGASLHELSVTEPGTYILSLSVIDPVSHGLCDTCEILLRVATPTPAGQNIKTASSDEDVLVTFGNVDVAGYTNIVESDTTGHETGNIQVLDQAYSIDTTVTFTGGVTISIHYDDSGLTPAQEKNLRMYKVVDTPWWKWWGDQIDITQSVDTVANVITGRTDTLSTFLIGHEVGTVPAKAVINHGPNPILAAGCIFWLDLPEGVTQAKLMILNVTGRPVFETALDVGATRFPSAGTWNPADQDGVELANGPYIYVLIADGKVIGQGKMVIQR